jgi:hypothetical protein
LATVWVYTPKEQTLKKYGFPALLALLWLSLASLSEAQEKYGPVRRGQDLWDIASQVAYQHYQHYQDAHVSHTQVMLALLATNPEAFTTPCNANSLLRVGVLLTTPTVAQASTPIGNWYQQHNVIKQPGERPPCSKSLNSCRIMVGSSLFLWGLSWLSSIHFAPAPKKYTRRKARFHWRIKIRSTIETGVTHYPLTHIAFLYRLWNF